MRIASKNRPVRSPARPAPFSCGGYVLAGKSADDDVSAPQLGQAGTDIGELFGVRESVGEHGAWHVGNLDLPVGCESCLLESEIEAADAGKQAADGGF